MRNSSGSTILRGPSKDMEDLQALYAAAAVALVRAAPPMSEMARRRLLDVTSRARRTSKAA
jgi:hypothetical protein